MFFLRRGKTVRGCRGVSGLRFRPAVSAATAGRGGDFLFSSAAADAEADAAVRETEPSMGPQPLARAHVCCGGSAQLSFENGGSPLSARMRVHVRLYRTHKIKAPSRDVGFGTTL